MFCIAVSETFQADVEFEILGADGKPKPAKFVGIFLRPSSDQIKEFDKRIENTRLKARLETLDQASAPDQYAALAAKIEADLDDVTDQEVIDDWLKGWDKVGDKNGVALAYGPEALKAMLEIPGASNAIATAFFQSIYLAKRKNSKAPLNGGGAR